MSSVLEQLIHEFEKRALVSEGVNAYGEVAEILSALPDRTLFLKSLLATARRCFMADHGAILSHHRPTGRWFVEAADGLDESAIEEIKGLSMTVVQRTSDAMESTLIPDATRNDLTRNSRSVHAYNIQAVICAPILNSRGEIWGVIYLDNSGIPNAFDDKSRKQLNQFASFCGTAIQTCDDVVRLTVPTRDSDGAVTDLDKPFTDYRSPRMLEIMRLLKRAAAADVPILIVGENGVGKDYLARQIHDMSPRGGGPYSKVNCANLQPTLMEAELFGVEKDTVTNVGFREGKIRWADGGTVLLNEIGELPLSTQAKILHVIQFKELDRVGADRPIAADVRFICATNRSLSEMVEEGTFRRDLYFRINIFEARIPPLRERMEDFPFLAEHILRQKCREYGQPQMRIPRTVMAQMAALPWQGNLRELANVIERGVILAEGDEFSLTHIISEPAGGRTVQIRKGDSLNDLVGRFESQVIRSVLEETGWTILNAADRLRVPESTLRFKMKKLGLRAPKILRGRKKSV